MDSPLRQTAKWLTDYHKVNDIDFEKALSPYFYLFDHYSKIISKNCTKQTPPTTIFVPEDVGCLLSDFEGKGTLYGQLLTFSSDLKATLWETEQSSEKYYRGYIFPYGTLSSVAYLSFMTAPERFLFKLLNIGRVKTCGFEMRPSCTLISQSARSSLFSTLSTGARCDLHWARAFTTFLPKCYLEDFSFYYDFAKLRLKEMSGISRVYFNRHALFNSNILFLLSIAAKKNVELITYQHGASYGQVEPSWSMLSEKSVCSTFLTWGYKYDEKEKPYFSTRLTKKISIPRFTTSTGSLIVLPLIDREGLFGCTPTIAKSSLSVALSLVSDQNYRIKPHPRNEECSCVGELFSASGIPKEKMVTGPLIDMLHQYKYLIFTSPDATGFLEALSRGYRPLMAFREGDFHIKAEANHIYHNLKKNGVWISEEKTQPLNLLSMPKLLYYSNFRQTFMRQSYFAKVRRMLMVIFGSRSR